MSVSTLSNIKCNEDAESVKEMSIVFCFTENYIKTWLEKELCIKLAEEELEAVLIHLNDGLFARFEDELRDQLLEFAMSYPQSKIWSKTGGKNV